MTECIYLPSCKTCFADFVHSKTGHVLVVPHHSVKQSLASSLSGGKVTSCEGLHHYPLVKFEEDWELNINEVSINNVRKLACYLNYTPRNELRRV